MESFRFVVEYVFKGSRKKKRQDFEISKPAQFSFETVIIV